MDIALITYPMDTDPSGIGVVVRNLVENIVSVDDRNRYSLLHHAKTGAPVYSGREVLYKRFHYLPCMFSDSFFLYRNSTRFDVVHRFLPGGFLYKVESKVVLTVHDLFFYKHYSFNRKFRVRNLLGRYFNRKMIEGADALIAVSEFTKKEILATFRVDPGKVHVVYNAVAGDAPEGNRGTLEEKYGIRNNYILFVGTIEPRKNLLGLVRAYEILAGKHGVDLDLVVVGKKGWDFRTTLDYITRSRYRDRIRLVGYVPSEDLGLFYRHANLFVYPSLMEGFGLPPLEAMACGCPVLISNTSSLPEVADDPGMMFDPLDLGEITEKCLAVLNDNHVRKANLEQGRKNVARFSWRASAEKLVRIYNSLEHA
ncbi:MAG: glycosyltransferase family 4 protein [Deltaproteobacteria bacterium]|nr:glycosyltransferase family 4 protein [Deltaproteobacteria bacterium]